MKNVKPKLNYIVYESFWKLALYKEAINLY